jgi:hypothetical protein
MTETNGKPKSCTFFSNPFLSPLVVIDFGVNKQLTPIYDLTSDTSAWPGSKGLTETNGNPKSRTFFSNPCNAA